MRCRFRSKTTGTAASRRLLLRLLCSCLSGLTYTHRLSALVDLAVGAPVLNVSHGPASATFAFSLALVCTVVVLLIHYLFDGLLADAIVTKVVKLLELVVKFSPFHLFVDLRNQVLEGALHIRRVECTRLQEFNLYKTSSTIRVFLPFTYLAHRRTSVLRPS